MRLFETDTAAQEVLAEYRSICSDIEKKYWFTALEALEILSALHTPAELKPLPKVKVKQKRRFAPRRKRKQSTTVIAK